MTETWRPTKPVRDMDINEVNAEIEKHGRLGRDESYTRSLSRVRTVINGDDPTQSAAQQKSDYESFFDHGQELYERQHHLLVERQKAEREAIAALDEPQQHGTGITVP